MIAHDADWQRDQESRYTHDKQQKSTDIRFRTQFEGQPYERKALRTLHENEKKTIDPQKTKWFDAHQFHGTDGH